MKIQTLQEEDIQTDVHRNECVQGEVVISAGHFHLDLLAQTSSKLLAARQLIPSTGSCYCPEGKRILSSCLIPLLKLKQKLMIENIFNEKYI